MNTRIYKKLCNRVRVTKEGNYWVVETREHNGEWQSSPTYSNLKKAIRFKHNLMQRLIGELGFLVWFKERRLKKINKARRKLVKQGNLTLNV